MREKHGYFLEDLTPGMSQAYSKTVTDADITIFAGVSGDTNPVHLDDSFAEQTIFIYLSQNMRFKAPVKVGDTVEARVTVKEVIEEKKRVVCETVCRVGDTVVVEGEAMLLVSRRAEIMGDIQAAE